MLGVPCLHWCHAGPTANTARRLHTFPDRAMYCTICVHSVCLQEQLCCVWHLQHIASSRANPVTDSALYPLLGLVNPKSVKSRYDTRTTKEVLSPLRVAEHNHVGADPHYCALTSNLQVIPMPHVLFAKGCTATCYAPVSLTVLQSMWNQAVCFTCFPRSAISICVKTTLSVGPQLVSGTVNNHSVYAVLSLVCGPTMQATHGVTDAVPS